jgi:tRNA(Ile2) C34 agmatinyltransferase TiaS
MVKVSKKSAVQQQGHGGRCHRCGGLMVEERVFELGSIDWRCVSCGERIDPVILAHRQVHQPKDLARTAAERLFIGHGKSRLN